MVLSNYWKALHILKDIWGSTGQIDYGMVGLDGEPYGVIYVSRAGWDDYTGIYRNTRLRTDDIGIRIGKGTGEISASDYSLFDDCTASFSNLSVANSVIPSNDGYRQTIVASGVNNSGADITITEAGITKSFFSGGSNIKPPLLLTKKMLNTPLTVENGDSFTLTFEWLES